MRTMYDSTTATDIPATAGMVGGYVDGLYAWSDADWNRFPATTVKVHIVVKASTNRGDVLDIERGDATPAQGPVWVMLRRGSGYPCPTLYCSRSDVPAVKAACKAAGLVFGTDWKLWIADYTGEPHSCNLGESAVQYASPGHGAGGHYDLSCVFDNAWPFPPPTTYIPPTGAVRRMDYVVSCLDHGHSTAQFLWRCDGTVLALGDQSEAQSLLAAGARSLPLTLTPFDKVASKAI